mgnify:CR=1 FL=1
MSQPNPQLEISNIVAAAQRLGVALDEAEALQCLTAMDAARADLRLRGIDKEDESRSLAG